MIYKKYRLLFKLCSPNPLTTIYVNILLNASFVQKESKCFSKAHFISTPYIAFTNKDIQTYIWILYMDKLISEIW